MSVLKIKDKNGNWQSITTIKGDKGDTPDLTGYATEEYVEKEIATFDFIKIVDELPETGLENRLYLVPKNDTQTQDLFDEYVWINNQWEWITTKQLEVDLTEYAKKSDIPDNLEIYSTEEQVIGTWLGKPLYRKVIVSTTTEAMASTSQVIATLDSNINVKKFDACMTQETYGGVVSAGSTYFSSTDYVYCFISANRELKARISDWTNYKNRTINVILEYTKTTD